MPEISLRTAKRWLHKYYLWLVMAGVILIGCAIVLPKVFGNKPAIAYNAMTPYNVVTGPPGNEFKNPVALAVGLNSELYIADKGNQRIIVMEEDGRFSMVFGGPGSGRAELGEPVGLDIAPNGNVFIADQGKQAVLVFNSKGEYLYTISDAKGTLVPLCIKTDKKGNAYVFDRAAKKFRVYDSQGKKIKEFPSRKLITDNSITAIDIDPDKGRIFGVSSDRSEYYEFTEDNIMTYEAGEVNEPGGIVYNRSKRLVFISDAYNNKIVVYDEQGKYLGEFGKTGNGMSEFRQPGGMAFDETGKMYVADRGNNRIVIYTARISGE